MISMVEDECYTFERVPDPSLVRGHVIGSFALLLHALGNSHALLIRTIPLPSLPGRYGNSG